MRAMEAVLAWQTSCRNIFKTAGLLQGKGNVWKISQFRYCTQTTLKHSSFTVDAVLPLLRAWRGPSENLCGFEDAEIIICRTLEVRVHAESALMHCIASVKVGVR